MRSTISPDPFDTTGLRRRVLDTWAGSPARFREDANAEEELARGAYRDRVIVELAQNAADAAVRAGIEGRLFLRLRGGTLTAANTGEPLDAAGVEGLSTLRASAKRDDDPDATVGRFGVGFAAVLAVTDAPAVLSTSGAVRWSRAEAIALTSTVPELAAELSRRGDAVPVLRLPLAGGPGGADPDDGGSGDGVSSSGELPMGYDTAVVLPLRDEAATTLTRALLSGIDDGLLLALPGLAEVVIDIDGDVRTLTATRTGDEVVIADDGSPTRWRQEQRSGRLKSELLAGRPAEEPDRWTVTVAVPVGAGGGPAPLPDSVPRVYHAPTPTDEPSALPVLILASWPMDSARRRVVGGVLTDFLATEVAAAYADLVTVLAGAGPDVLSLVPGPLPVGELDATVQRAIVDVLSRTPFVPAATPPAVRLPTASWTRAAAPPAKAAPAPRLLAPRDATVVVGAAAAADLTVLARFVPGLPDPSWWRSQSLRRLGGREVALDEVIDSLAGFTQGPNEWRELYAALDGVDVTDLVTLPVPLADGRTVRSARGVLLPTSDVDVAALAGLGLRLVHPDAVHPLLTRLGATEATPAAVLRDPTVRAAVQASEEDDADVRLRVEAILGLVAGSGLGVDDQPWLADMWLPAADGALAPAGELWLPGSPALAVLDVEPAAYTVDAELVRRWGRHVLTAVGVQDRFALVRETDLPLDDQEWPNLPDFQEWVEVARGQLGGSQLPPIVTELLAVRDLDLVSDDRWPDVVTMLAEDADLRKALVEPTYVTRQDGSRQAIPPYTAWWLRTYARIPGPGHGGGPVGELCAADSDPIVQTLLLPMPVTLDDQVSSALGLVRTLDDLVAAPGLLLDRLADADLELSAAGLGAVYRALGTADVDLDGVRPPDWVRVPTSAGSRVVPAADVLVADSPQWLQLDLPALIPGTPALADVLDVDLAADVHPSVPSSAGTEAAVPTVVRQVLPTAPPSYIEHDDLIVAGQSVTWWVDEDATVHAATLAGLARGLAWVSGSWRLRTLLAEVLHNPADVDTLIAEQAYD